MLVIPMSGQGKRFVAAEYRDPKPLIRVDGRPIIAHTLDLFPGERDALFICNENHLRSTGLEGVLKGLRPDALIRPIPSHDQGPVWAIRQAYDLIPDDEDVMVSYCDYTGLWDYRAFREAVRATDADGAIPSYIGFHPHLLGPNRYGAMTHDGNLMMTEMREKHSFTGDPMREHNAIGAYWFRSGALMKRCFDEAIARDMRTGKELFCSMPYNLLVAEGKKVRIHPVEKFCQWGTPEDLEEYEAWSRAFADLSGSPKGLTDIPLERERNVRARVETPERHPETFGYWQGFFSRVPWHPYEGPARTDRS